jgi:hypothetical protein
MSIKRLIVKEDYQVECAEKVSGFDTGEHKHSVEEFTLYIDDYVRRLKQQLSSIWTPDGKANQEALGDYA